MVIIFTSFLVANGRRFFCSLPPIHRLKCLFASPRICVTNMNSNSESTQIVRQMCAGDHRGVDRLFELAYDDLHVMAEKYTNRFSSRSVRPTELVHDAFLKLVDQQQVDWRGKSHFMAVGAVVMRHILVDLARRKQAQKRGGDRRQLLFDDVMMVSVTDFDDVLAVDEALLKLAEVNETQAKLIELRFFTGMTVAEAAEAIGKSKRYVEKQWTFAKAWLRRELSEGADHDA